MGVTFIYVSKTKLCYYSYVASEARGGLPRQEVDHGNGKTVIIRGGDGLTSRLLEMWIKLLMSWWKPYT